jgi:ABC-2 type transport system ATP-binding protein
VPGDGTVASLRGLLDRLDDARVEVEDLSIHTPDLDDVFFAVTGHSTVQPTTEEALQR